MIINNLANTEQPYTIRNEGSGSTLQGKVKPESFVEVTPPGNPPYSVGMKCNGFKGIESADVMVSWYREGSAGIFRTNPSKAASSDE
jgi:hypothetical protein